MGKPLFKSKPIICRPADLAFSLVSAALARCPASAHMPWHQAMANEATSNVARSTLAAALGGGNGRSVGVGEAEEVHRGLLGSQSVQFAPPSADQVSCPPQVVLEGGWHNRVALPVLDALGAAVMRTWNNSLPLWQYHHSYQWPVRARCVGSK